MSDKKHRSKKFCLVSVRAEILFFSFRITMGSADIGMSTPKLIDTLQFFFSICLQKKTKINWDISSCEGVLLCINWSESEGGRAKCSLEQKIEQYNKIMGESTASSMDEDALIIMSLGGAASSTSQLDSILLSIKKEQIHAVCSNLVWSIRIQHRESIFQKT